MVIPLRAGTEQQAMMPTKIEQAEAAIATPDSYPWTFTGKVCLICAGNDAKSYQERVWDYKRKDTLQHYLNTHLRHRNEDEEFECPHPLCSEWLAGTMQFKNHAARVHKIS